MRTILELMIAATIAASAAAQVPPEIEPDVLPAALEREFKRAEYKQRMTARRNYANYQKSYITARINARARFVMPRTNPLSAGIGYNNPRAHYYIRGPLPVVRVARVPVQSPAAVHPSQWPAGQFGEK